MQHIFVSIADSLSAVIYNASIWTKNSCQCAINDCHILYSSFVLLQKLFKQNGLTHVLRTAKVWLCQNVTCTLPALLIFVARYLCQYSDWATCWLTAETGFSSWWRKNFSCQHCVHPAFCPKVQGLLFSFRVKAVLVLMLSTLCWLVSWAKRGWSFIFTRRPIITVMLLFWTSFHKQLSFDKWENRNFLEWWDSYVKIALILFI
jgi:hypothetical protein